jgi:hypothetical protein
VADTPKIIDGEVVGWSEMGDLINRKVAPTPPGRLARRTLTPEQEEAGVWLKQQLDTQALERTLFRTHAGYFVGLCYDPDGDTETPLEPHARTIILTDEDR